jgi:hypothetical protein
MYRLLLRALYRGLKLNTVPDCSFRKRPRCHLFQSSLHFTLIGHCQHFAELVTAVSLTWEEKFQSHQ